MSANLEKELNPDKLQWACSVLATKVREYFKVEEHRKDFEEWYRKEYGKEYEWNH